MSLRGYCRTESERIDCRPAIRMTRLTTIARTGRRMKRSVNFICEMSSSFGPGGSAVFGLRRGGISGLRRVVHLDRGPVAELEYSRGHDLLARLDARHDRDLVSASRSELDELLAHALVGLALRAP